VAKARWFRDPAGWVSAPHELEFRVGGRELSSGGQGCPVHAYRALYWDIVEDARIVYIYEMLIDGTRVSIRWQRSSSSRTVAGRGSS
jgi:uncharacterized protein YndB with AHSA1/START domain